MWSASANVAYLALRDRGARFAERVGDRHRCEAPRVFHGQDALAEEDLRRYAGEPLAGPPGWWVETLAAFVADGFDTLVFWPVDTAPAQVELLVAEVLPDVRASV
jgi:hypothetical protein